MTDRRHEVADVAGVRITNPERPLFGKGGPTKGDLARYFAHMAERILPFVADRPLSLVRCPEGIDGDCFFHRHATESLPSPVRAVGIEERSGEMAEYLYVDSCKALVSLAQIGAIELHPWGAKIDSLERPEQIVFDLDPGAATPFSQVRRAARAVRECLAKESLPAFLKATGGKGLHVVVPLAGSADWPTVKAFAKSVATSLADAEPDRYIAVAKKSERRGRVFIDYLRNDRSATAIAPYSPRARPGAPIACPIRWRELHRIEGGGAHSMKTIGRRLAHLASEPWSGFGEAARCADLD